ncbi:hypothetical protein BCR39DRAFT_559342 [Naematelia encephala]|uniref:Peptidase C15, pyroglutamyl peptidase I-like protein n=1 Tax=Naematelia encephala TaxID=71784 RepID=A0A1Y2B2Q8_9TREE|nr:hypothetical protein BCR39DRAFT_559342 [Naematelia encephala]
MPALPAPDKSTRRPKILVTGFAPWGPNTLNPSSQITSLLLSSSPPVLSPNHLIHPTPIQVSYSTVRSQIPDLLETVQPDMVLHIGLAGIYRWYGLEKSAPRSGFKSPDVDGRIISSEQVDDMWPPNEFTTTTTTLIEDSKSIRVRRGGDSEGDRNGEKGDSLVTETPYDDIVDRWISKCQATVPDVAVRESDGVGAYLCGFIYHTSLRWFKRKGKRGDVLFLHVPPCPTEVDLENGKQVVLALLQAMEETWISEADE